MPRTTGTVNAAEGEAVRNEIKAMLAYNKISVRSLVDRLNEEYDDVKEYVNTLNNQINAGTLPAWKERRIARLLGYRVIWKKEDGNSIFQ